MAARKSKVSEIESLKGQLKSTEELYQTALNELRKEKKESTHRLHLMRHADNEAYRLKHENAQLKKAITHLSSVLKELAS